MIIIKANAAYYNVSCPGCTLGQIVSNTAGKSGIVGGVNGIFLTG
ncbi:hypothetical protein [Methanospirillum lacunae]|nr:hypothetical protein [Methanospirillum lacunae]